MTPRTIAPWEACEPGDLFFESEATLTAFLIRFSQLDGLNHTGIIVDGGHGDVLAVEALGDGVVMHRRPSPTGYVLRLTDCAELRRAIVRSAVRLSRREVRYSWWTILWHAGRTFRRPLITRPLGALLQRMSARRAARDTEMICSEAVYVVLREALSNTDAAHVDLLLRQFDTVEPFEVSPIDLFRALLGRRA